MLAYSLYRICIESELICRKLKVIQLKKLYILIYIANSIRLNLQHSLLQSFTERERVKIDMEHLNSTLEINQNCIKAEPKPSI